jgi:hypothetical protein
MHWPKSTYPGANRHTLSLSHVDMRFYMSTHTHCHKSTCTVMCRHAMSEIGTRSWKSTYTVKWKNTDLLIDNCGHVDMTATHADVPSHDARKNDEQTTQHKTSYRQIDPTQHSLQHVVDNERNPRKTKSLDNMSKMKPPYCRRSAHYTCRSTSRRMSRRIDVSSAVDALPSTCRHMPWQQPLRVLLLPPSRGGARDPRS